jgi:type VI secretion system secreted protein Hcp
MPAPFNEIADSAGGVIHADIFLHVQTKRAGKIKGEASTAGHADDIEVRGWSWGAQAGSAIGSTAATARRSYKQLVVVKALDSASTGLLKALASNDEVVEAKLGMRKAGGEALDYYTLTLAGARVVNVDVDVDAQGRPIERVVFAFTKVDIEYQRQQAAGGSGGAFTFSDEVLPA